MSSILNIKRYLLKNYPLGLIQYSSLISENLYLHTFSLGEGFGIEAVSIQTSEAYAGSTYGVGFAWEHEIGVCTLLAVSRVLTWDFEEWLENC